MKPETAGYLTDLPEKEPLFPSDKAARAGNYIIDRLIYVLFMVVIYVNPGRLFDFDPMRDRIIWYTISMAFLVLYYILFEYFLGKTPAKFLTGTRVVSRDGGKPSFAAILIRSLSRMIPLNQFSLLIFDRPWHDSLSKTKVVNNKPAVGMQYVPFAIIIVILLVSLFYKDERSGTVKTADLYGSWALGRANPHGHSMAYIFRPDSTVSMLFSDGFMKGTWSVVKNKNAEPDVVSELMIKYTRENVLYHTKLNVKERRKKTFLAEGTLLYGKHIQPRTSQPEGHMRVSAPEVLIVPRGYRDTSPKGRGITKNN